MLVHPFFILVATRRQRHKVANGLRFGFYFRYYRNVRTVLNTFFELNYTVNHSEQCVVFAHTHVYTRVMRSTSLSYNDVTSDDILATINFNTKSFRMRLAAVIRTTSSFFVCHFFYCLIGLASQARKGFTFNFFLLLNQCSRSGPS
jgi:hypothetical protein